MLVVYANKKDKKIAYDWKRYVIRDLASADAFKKGIDEVFDRSQQRIDEMRKVACRGQRGGNIVVNM